MQLLRNTNALSKRQSTERKKRLESFAILSPQSADARHLARCEARIARITAVVHIVMDVLL